MNLFFKYYNIIIHFYYITGKLLRIDKISEKDTLFPKNEKNRFGEIEMVLLF